MTNQELLYRIALTKIPQIGCVQARALLQHLDVAAIFSSKQSTLEKLEGIGSVRAKNITHFKDFSAIEKEIAFIEKYQLQTFFIADDNYPQKLLNCYDAPVMLYYKGNISLSHEKTIAIVGSRTHTDYGAQQTEAMIAAWQNEGVCIISGLAYGIDAVAHKAALKHQLPTIGVLAHGLDTIYPAAHKSLAKEMLENGGLLTEFTTATKPDRHNFPSRNRVVAGLADAIIVIETDIKGGSMITAEIANSYNKDVFALPGKTTDRKSNGCNHLIKHNKAILLTDAQQLLDYMNWGSPKSKSPAVQQSLLLHLSGEERTVYNLIAAREGIHIDEIYTQSGLSSSIVAAAILNLEMEHIIKCLPGKCFSLK